MREQLIKAMQRNQLVNIMYGVKDDSLACWEFISSIFFTRCAKRTFLISNVLVVIPCVSKGCDVV